MNLDFASVWEMISDIVPENDALICGDEIISWKDYDFQSSKIATALKNAGLGPNSKAGLYLNNSNEYLIGQNAIFKIGGVPINVNYRYVAEELIYLLDNSDSEAVFYHACYSSRIKEISGSLPNIKAWIEIADGTKSEFEDSLKFEELLDSCDPMERIHRDPNTIYMLYTGGTTGMPKGVMYKQGEFLVFLFRTLKAMGYDVPEDINNLEEQIHNFKKDNTFIKSLIGCPLMHGTGMWLGAFLPLLLGGTAVTSRNLGFDPDQMWTQVEDTRTTNIVIVGDLDHSRVTSSFVEGLTNFDIGSLIFSGHPEMCTKYQNPEIGRYEPNLDKALENADVIMTLRIQHERFDKELNLDLDTYKSQYQLSLEKLENAKGDAIIMHPGPVNYIEITEAVYDSDNSVIRQQVANGVSVRMAILSRFLGS